MNDLHCGDNPTVLRDTIASESVDLIYLDPPFNSNATYSHLFKDESGQVSGAQIAAFDDTWHWLPRAHETAPHATNQPGARSGERPPPSQHAPAPRQPLQARGARRGHPAPRARSTSERPVPVILGLTPRHPRARPEDLSQQEIVRPSRTMTGHKTSSHAGRYPPKNRIFLRYCPQPSVITPQKTRGPA
jgi:hypothetical protein